MTGNPNFKHDEVLIKEEAGETVRVTSYLVIFWKWGCLAH